MAGIVHFSKYLCFVEEAEHALWRAAGLSIVPPGGDISFPRVAASLEFHAPLHFEEEFEVLIRIAEKTRRSIRYTTEITRGETKIATGTHTAVCVKKSAMKAIPIPDDIVQRLS
jgi:4-hydroxybenzoyl-CoA thioesterase/acyl-CoA thioester hydrolase